MCRPRFRRERIELRHVAGLPRQSIETWAPPPVSSRIAPGTSAVAFASMTISAPQERASSSLSAAMSTPITRAPWARAIIVAERPTPPQPCTATHSPGRVRPCPTTARYAVAKRHPKSAAVVKVMESGRRTRFTSAYGRATNSAKVPQPVKPGW